MYPRVMIEMTLSRRQVVWAISAGISAVSAGCYDYPRSREISFGRISIEEERPDEYVLRLEYVKSATGSSDEWNTFHDVRVVGYSESGELICEKPIGDISKNGGEQSVTVTCSDFPHLFTFDAEESPCDEDTTIMISEYKGIRDEVGHYWLADRERQCTEGLPPPLTTNE